MSIGARLSAIQKRIYDTAHQYGRNPDDICLVAVSKNQPIEAIKEAFACGIRHFGESYWQEAQEKMQALQDLPIIWHFIGPIQSNKAAQIAQHFSWVHSLCREKIALSLSQHRPAQSVPLNVCLQVNLDEEITKSGLAVLGIDALATQVSKLPNLRLRGLMAIPEPKPDEASQYQSLLRLTQLLKQTNNQLGLSMDTLSMGMSEDFVPAIAAGSTIIRLGRVIFGERLPSPLREKGWG